MDSERQALVGDASIAVLARLGVRGLTHRAVDDEAGLPDGATSNVARSRAALLQLAMRRLIELEAQAFSGMTATARDDASVDDVARTFALLTHVQLTERSRRTLARYALALEAIRDEPLMALYAEAGRALVLTAEGALQDLGSTDPQRHARRFLAFLEGLLFSTVVDRRPSPSVDDLAEGFADLLNSMLGKSLAQGERPG